MEESDGMMYRDDLMAIEAAIAAAAAAGRPRQTTNVWPADDALIRKQRPFLTPLYRFPRRADRRESEGENLDPTAVHPRPPTDNIVRLMRKPRVINFGTRRHARESKPRGESISENLKYPLSAVAATAIGRNVEMMRHSFLNMDLGKSSEEKAAI